MSSIPLAAQRQRTPIFSPISAKKLFEPDSVMQPASAPIRQPGLLSLPVEQAPSVQMPAADLNQALFSPTAPSTPKLANAPIAARPQSTWDNLGGLGKAGMLASIFAAELGRPGSGQMITQRLNNEVAAQRQYDQTRPVMQQQANEQAVNTALNQENKRWCIPASAIEQRPSRKQAIQ